MTRNFHHIPVLLPETIAALLPHPGGRYLDATVGAGGHAQEVLELSSPDGTLIGMDADPRALAATAERLADFGERIQLKQAYSDDLLSVVQQFGSEPLDGILFDLGVSSPQLDDAERGFSFQHEAPLDMRFGPLARVSAADLVNELPARELEDIFRRFGEERYARRIAREIVARRHPHRIETTTQLASLVRQTVPRTHRNTIHPATRVFQALRIAVNDELGRLQRALEQTVQVLAAKGRVVVITFHSLEDRIVKHFFRDYARDCVCPPEVPICTCGHHPELSIVTRKPITPSTDEIERNPRSRSAKLRVAERTPTSLMPSRNTLARGTQQ